MKGRTRGKIREADRFWGTYSLKAAEQLNRIDKAAYGTLAFISRGIQYKNKEIMLELYRMLVRPQLEYCLQFWSPHYRKDVIALEGVQRRFAKMLPGMEHLSYKETG